MIDIMVDIIALLFVIESFILVPLLLVIVFLLISIIKKVGGL